MTRPGTEADSFTPKSRTASHAPGDIQDRGRRDNVCSRVLTHCQCFSAALQRTPLSATLSLVMSQCCQKIKDTVQKLASDPKDIHSSVSRVGKAIDRVGVWVPWAEVVMPGAGIHEAHQEGKCGKCESLGPCPQQNFVRFAMLSLMQCGTRKRSSSKFCRWPSWSTYTSRVCLVWLRSCAK